MNYQAIVLASIVMTTLVSEGLAQVSPTDDRPVFSARERYQNCDVCKLEKNYVYSLQSENDGVVESAIAQSVGMKFALPSCPFTEIRAALASLAVTGRTPTLRYKAYLAGLVFDDPGMFTAESARTYMSTAELFSALNGRLRSALIGFQNRRYVGPEWNQ